MLNCHLDLSYQRLNLIWITADAFLKHSGKENAFSSWKMERGIELSSENIPKLLLPAQIEIQQLYGLCKR